jgi:hypothetical protein
MYMIYALSSFAIRGERAYNNFAVIARVPTRKSCNKTEIYRCTLPHHNIA